MDIYTPIEEAGEIIRKRFVDKDLRKKVEEKLDSDMPEILKEGNCGMIGRCIGTPDREFERFLELCKKANLKPVCFEYIDDRFFSGNFTKYGLTSLPFSYGVDKNLKTITKREKIIDFEYTKGKILRMCDLKTLWGENLVDFHHFFLQEMFPIMKEKIVDTSDWFSKSANGAKNYYTKVLSLAICHFVLFDDFDLLEEENDFVDKVVLPIFNEIKEYFGIKPIIVKISDVGEHERDPYWWSYSKKAKEIMDNHIKIFK